MKVKKVINGLVYDTELSESIYFDKKNKREYFMTKNRRFFCVYRTKEIQVKSEDFIRDLLGTYDYDMYVKIFGEPEEAQYGMDNT